MVLFMSIYSIFALGGILSEIKNKKISLKFEKGKQSTDISTIYLFLCCMVMDLLCGLRSVDIGTDTKTYVDSFLNSNTLNTTINGERKFELGYILFVNILRRFTDNIHVFIFIVSLISFIGIYLFIKNNCESSYSISILIYVALLYYTNFSAMRQGIALAIAINSVGYIRKKQLIPAMILILIGGMFHFTALVLLVFLPLSLSKWTSRKVIEAIILSFVGIGFFEIIVGIILHFFPIYARYWNAGMMTKEGTASVGVFAIFVALVCICAIMQLIRSKSELGDEEKRNSYIIALVGSIFCLAINLLGRKYGIFSRMTRFFIPFVMVLISDICGYFMKKNKVCCCFIIAVMMGIYFFVIIKGNSYQIIPYKFFWR